MHLAPLTARLLQAIEDAENTFFARSFGNIGRKRSKRPCLLCGIDSAAHERKMVALRKLEKAKERKERVVSGTPPKRNVGEVQWVCRDIAAMPHREKFQEMVGHLKNGIAAKRFGSSNLKSTAPHHSHTESVKSRMTNLKLSIPYFIAPPTDRGWQRNEGPFLQYNVPILGHFSNVFDA